MDIVAAYSFLVRPGKNEQLSDSVGGVSIPLSGNLYMMIAAAFFKANNECSIEIVFNPADDGSQKNETRSAIVALLRQPSIERSRVLAERLQMATTNRSGLALFFVAIGIDKSTHQRQIYLARFPADNGVLAEEEDDELRVEFVERVFMKSAYSYKAAVYSGTSFDADFWEGRAVDKQITNHSVEISGYWISDFLDSDFKTTSAVGTKRFANAIRETIRQTDDLEIKEELAAAATLAKGLKGKVITISSFAEQMHLSEKTRAAMVQTLKKPAYAFSSFKFSSKEFQKHIGFRRLHLDNDAILSAPAGKFDTCFSRKAIGGAGQVEISTRGRVVNENLSKA